MWKQGQRSCVPRHKGVSDAGPGYGRRSAGLVDAPGPLASKPSVGLNEEGQLHHEPVAVQARLMGGMGHRSREVLRLAVPNPRGPLPLTHHSPFLAAAPVVTLTYPIMQRAAHPPGIPRGSITELSADRSRWISLLTPPLPWDQCTHVLSTLNMVP